MTGKPLIKPHAGQVFCQGLDIHAARASVLIHTPALLHEDSRTKFYDFNRVAMRISSQPKIFKEVDSRIRAFAD